MSKPVPIRRIVALIATYVIALQALLLPLSVAAGSPLQASLCSQASNGSPVQHDAGCPCAAGCGTQCHAPSLLGPPQQIGVVLPRAGVIVGRSPVMFAAIVRVVHRRPQIPRAPPTV